MKKEWERFLFCMGISIVFALLTVETGKRFVVRAETSTVYKILIVVGGMIALVLAVSIFLDDIRKNSEKVGVLSLIINFCNCLIQSIVLCIIFSTPFVYERRAYRRRLYQVDLIMDFHWIVLTTLVIYFGWFYRKKE